MKTSVCFQVKSPFLSIGQSTGTSLPIRLSWAEKQYIQTTKVHRPGLVLCFLHSLKLGSHVMRLYKYLLRVLGNPAGLQGKPSSHSKQARAGLLIPLLSEADQIAQCLIKCQFPSTWRGEKAISSCRGTGRGCFSLEVKGG